MSIFGQAVTGSSLNISSTIGSGNLITTNAGFDTNNIVNSQTISGLDSNTIVGGNYTN